MPLCHHLGHSGDVSQRLFLALWPPPEVVSEVDAALPRDLSELRWQPPTRWHVTVVFLGERGVEKELRRLDRLQVPDPAPMRLQGVGAFGPVLWLGVAADQWLGGLAGACAELFDTGHRPFRAHMTVARARSAAGRRQILEALGRLHTFRSSAWLPQEITLVRSQTGPRPLYEVIGRRRLPAT